MTDLITRPKRRGVTLIEAIMVIVFLSAAAVATSFVLDNQWLAQRHVVSSTRDTVRTLESARNTAIMSRSTVRVRRQRVGGTQQLRITEDAGPLGDGKNWTVDLGTDTRLRGAPAEIRFNPNGGSNRALRWIVSESRTFGRVNVSPTDGQVTSLLP